MDGGILDAVDSAGTVALNGLPEVAKRVLVVHGRDDRARTAMFDFVRALGLHPVEWGQLVTLAGGGAPYNGQVVAKGLEEVRAVVVLFTPDDVVGLHPRLAGGDVEAECQPRPNVILEAGMALATMPLRTIIVEVGRIRPITDLDGRNVVRLSPEGGPAPLNDLATRLDAARCTVDRSGNDWLDHDRWSSLDAFRRSPNDGRAEVESSAAAGALAERAQELAREIHDYLGDRERDDPMRRSRAHLAEANEAERQRAFDDETARVIEHSRVTMRLFAQRYQARALALLEQLIEIGLAFEEDRFRFEHPTNPLGIAEVATRLGVAAERLKSART